MPSVLVIDDDTNILRIITSQLTTLGCQVSIAYSGREGELKTRTEKPDLILLDIMMPNQNGYTTCERLREQGYQGVIAMMSSISEGTGTKMSMEAGANGYLIKPIDASLLSQMVEYINVAEQYPTVKEWLAAM